MSETERGDFRLKFEMVDQSINDSVCQSLSLRGKEREQHRAQESTAEGNGEHSVSHRGQAHTSHQCCEAHKLHSCI